MGTDENPRKVPVEGWSTGQLVAIILGGCFVTLTVVALIIFLCCYCRRRTNGHKLAVKQSLHDSLLSHSAPISRRESPKPPRRTSCPDTSAGLQTSEVVRSSVSDSSSELNLFPERVQPKALFEKGLSTNPVLEEEYRFIGNLPTDIYASGARTSDDESDGNINNFGSIIFKCEFNSVQEKLKVHLIKVESLPGRGRNNFPRDPYVKLYLLPDEQTYKLSKTCPATLNPFYDEIFEFEISAEEVPDRTLRLSVYDVDKKRVRHSLGHAFVPLSDLDLQNPTIQCRGLLDLLEFTHNTGELQLSLTYVPNEDRIKVIINKARNLQCENQNGMYVKIEFYHGQRLCKTKRTAIKKGTFDPEYNESFTFNIRSKRLDSCSIRICLVVVQPQPNVDDDEYGQVILGPFTVCRGESLKHWTEMMTNPRQLKTKSHRLERVTTDFKPEKVSSDEEA